ncbi:hypothetical protein DL96DRAFT_1470249 [Flagelloscypha sp. PMI_526]|nr:hypothetical protein DL96DRAFT_1470249 [Flagelloscypha sp. PMI_526]
MASNINRLRSISLYKDLHRLGRDYPDPNFNYHGKLRRMFQKNRTLTDPKEIEDAFNRAEFMKRETLALYFLRKYRHLKRVYPPTSMGDPPHR